MVFGLYKVWDENREEDDAEEIEAYDAEDAVIQYVKEDSDGFNDGLYCNSSTADYACRFDGTDGHDLFVKDPTGEITCWVAGVEDFEPVYAAYQKKENK